MCVYLLPATFLIRMDKNVTQKCENEGKSTLSLKTPDILIVYRIMKTLKCTYRDTQNTDTHT